METRDFCEKNYGLYIKKTFIDSPAFSFTYRCKVIGYMGEVLLVTELSNNNKYYSFGGHAFEVPYSNIITSGLSYYCLSSAVKGEYPIIQLKDFLIFDEAWEVENDITTSTYKDKCILCNSPALLMFVSCECSNTKCKNYVIKKTNKE